MISEQIAKEMIKLYGEENVKTFSCELAYEKEINDYIMAIEDAHKKTANSKLVFK